MVKLGQDYDVYPRKVAEGTIPFRRFVKQGTGDDGVALCGAQEEALGVSEFDLRSYNLDGSARTGYVQYEKLPIRRKGIAIVEAATAMTVGTLVESSSIGKASPYTAPSASSPNYLYSDLASVRDAYKIVQGRVQTAATAAGDLIEVDLEYGP